MWVLVTSVIGGAFAYVKGFSSGAEINAPVNTGNNGIQWNSVLIGGAIVLGMLFVLKKIK